MEPDASAVRAIGCCGSCGGQAFTLKIYNCGFERAHCSGCGIAWDAGWQKGEASVGGHGQDAEGYPAVEGARDE